jgi:hypothetical protein
MDYSKSNKGILRGRIITLGLFTVLNLISVLIVPPICHPINQTPLLVKYNFENVVPGGGVLVTIPPSDHGESLIHVSNFRVAPGSGVALLSDADKDGVVASNGGNQMSFQQGIDTETYIYPWEYHSFEFSLQVATVP